VSLYPSRQTNLTFSIHATSSTAISHQRNTWFGQIVIACPKQLLRNPLGLPETSRGQVSPPKQCLDILLLLNSVSPSFLAAPQYAHISERRVATVTFPAPLERRLIAASMIARPTMIAAFSTLTLPKKSPLV